MFSFLKHLRLQKKIHTVNASDSIWSVLELMESNRVGAVLILDQGKLAGIFTERDLLLNWRNLSSMALKEIPIRKVMTKKVHTLSAGKLEKAAVFMLAKKFRHLPVLDGDKIINFISIRDVLEMLIEENDELRNQLDSRKG